MLFQKLGYDADSDRAKRLLIAVLQYVTTSGKDLDGVVESLKDTTQSKDNLTRDRADRLWEIIATQHQRLREIEAEIKSTTTILTRFATQPNEENVSANRGLRALVEESTSISKLIDILRIANAILH